VTPEEVAATQARTESTRVADAPPKAAAPALRPGGPGTLTVAAAAAVAIALTATPLLLLLTQRRRRRPIRRPVR